MQTVNFEEIRKRLASIRTVSDVKEYLGLMLNLTEISYEDAVKSDKINKKLRELTDKYRKDMEALIFSE